MMPPITRRALPAQMTLTVLATAILAIVPLVLVAAWATARVDEQSLDRERQLVEQALTDSVAKVAFEQQSISIWDDAVIQSREGNRQWMIENIGEWMNTYYGHDDAFVLDQADRPVYVMLGGTTRPVEAFSAREAVVLPQAEELRAQLADGADPAEASIAQVVLIDGLPAIVSIVPIVPSTDRLSVPSGSEYLHVSVELMDADFLAGIGRQYMINDVHFIPQGGATAESSTVPLDGRAGPLGRVGWTPARPGHHLMMRTLPVVVASFVALLALSAWLLARLLGIAAALHRNEAQAQRMALHDELTGLPNRALFNLRLDAALAGTKGGDCFALHYVDLDRFKHVNDTLGHPAGDELIRQVGQRLSALLSPGDTVARLGGDEFAVIQTRVRDWRDSEALANGMIEAVRGAFELGDDTAFVDASIGIALAPSAADTRSELMRMADIALYQAKGAGKGRHCIFEQSLDEVVRQKRLIERDLREALDQGVGLTLAYQPLFAIDGTTLVGAEALIRWNHPVHGGLSPSAFIGIAEERGLIHSLGYWVLREACLTAKQLDLPWIAVNVSAVQFRDAGFVDVVLDLLKELEFSPERLQLEITEGLLLDASDAVSDTLMKLRFAGIRIALDDFGTGYSSLAYLHRYKVDKIKIDRSFVRSLGTPEESAAIVRAMMQLAAALNLDVTAEGVETPEQWQSLASLGDPELQGFLFSRPLLSEALRELRGDAPGMPLHLIA